MVRLTALVSTAVGLCVYGLSTWATYNPEIRGTRLYWLIGMAAAVVGHGLWTFVAQSLDSQRRVLMYALLWDVGFTVVSLLVPALLFKLKISPVGYAGIALVVGGGLLIKEFGFVDG